MSRLNIAAVEVLIYGKNRNLVQLEKTALAAFEFRKMHWSATLVDMRENMSLMMRDVVIINDDPELDLEQTLQMLRTDPSIANPFAVIIIVTPNASRQYVSKALRIGADGVIGLPFSAADLWKQLAFFVNNQRTFLRTHSYFGPDRRRLKGVSYGGEERRCGEEFDEDHKVDDRSRFSA